MTDVQTMVSKVFQELADALETGSFGPKTRVGVTLLGSEHGVEEVLAGAELAQKRDNSIEVVVIGPDVDTTLTKVIVETEDDGYAKMEEMLDDGSLSACVTMHYNFPIGVSTVGRVTTPAAGKDMILATTTGTSATNRVEGMVRNALYGIATAKATGIAEPTVGLLNVDGVRGVERILRELDKNGYPIRFATSNRSDGGAVMRGNDLLQGVADVMVQDTLTGNLLMKMFSSFTTGGGYESTGFGYGPGIGEDYDRLVLIISRASGAPVIANALLYGAEVARGHVLAIAKEEMAAARKAGLDNLIADATKEKAKTDDEEEFTMPADEIVTETIAGIDILDLDEAAKTLWKEGVYAESGMGCTGPIIMVNKAKLDQAQCILAKAGYIEGDAGAAGVC